MLSGAPKDRFHFAVPTPEFLANRQSIDIGYGAEFVLLRAAPPRDVRIAYTEPGSPATAPEVNLSRGAQILEIDGESMLDSDNIAVLNNGLFPRTAGESHTFTVLDLGSSTPRTVTMASVEITSHPVQNVRVFATPSGDRIGYMLFNTHSAPASQAIIEVGKHLKNAGIDDLIVDLRYNGGGLLYVAQIFSSMIAGTEKEGLVFEEFETNGKIPSESQEFTLEYAASDVIDAVDLTVPSLGLPRLFVLTSPRYLLGKRISHKQFARHRHRCNPNRGLLPAANPTVSNQPRTAALFTIRLASEGVNAKGEADFEDGFTPHCRVAEDFNHQLGDPEEILLKTALAYRTSGVCPPADEESSRAIGPSTEPPSGEAISRPPGFSGKIVGSGISQSN